MTVYDMKGDIMPDNEDKKSQDVVDQYLVDLTSCLESLQMVAEQRPDLLQGKRQYALAGITMTCALVHCLSLGKEIA